MWRNNKKLLGIVAGLFLVLLIWNIYNISSAGAISVSEKALAAQEENIKAVIFSGEGELAPGFIFTDEAILQQRKSRQKLETELGKRFSSAVFRLPNDFTPGANQSAKVFFNEKADEIKSALVKKCNAAGFRLAIPLQFGDADESTVRLASTLLYLVNRMINAAVDGKLKSADTITQKPVRTEYSEQDGFEFEVYTARFTFTGKPGDIFSFIDSFNDIHDDPLKQKVFLSEISVSSRDDMYKLEMDCSLVSFKGRLDPQQRKEREEAREKAKTGTPGKMKKQQKVNALGI